MKKKIPEWLFKPIETKYKGYRFRSRLEARWAVFFDTLGIEYEYEKEGFDLEGTWYLPDFWLPEQECWVEIKGEEPTEVEKQKARLLSLYTNKWVFIFSGAIGFPHDYHHHDIHLEHPPALFLRHFDNHTQKPTFVERETTLACLSLLQKMASVYLLPYVTYGGDSEPLIGIMQKNHCFHLGVLDLFIEEIQEQHDMLAKIASLLLRHRVDLIEALTVEEGWQIDFQAQDCGVGGLEWVECPSCEEIHIAVSGFEHNECPNTPKGMPLADSTRLLEAYTAARQARFDGKEQAQ